MKHRSPIFLACLCILLVSLACQLSNSVKDPTGKMRVESVDVIPDSGSGTFKALVSLPGFSRADKLVCYTALITGAPSEHKTVYKNEVPVRETSQIVEFEFTETQPGNYRMYCMDEAMETDSAKGDFTVVAPPAATVPDASQPLPTTPGGFITPKPGAFSTAGMWMTFDQGTSSVKDYAVPRQCLPGVNYTHAGGTSSFDIDPAGNITGACSLSYYDGKMRLSGSMSGTWDGTSDLITFNLVTVTEIDFELNGQTGHSTNTTTFTGTARFNSAIQGSGTANWSTECTSTNTGGATCFGPAYPATLNANGTVPFVINFNAK